MIQSLEFHLRSKYSLNIFHVISCLQICMCFAGCSGSTKLPLSIGTPKTQVSTGRKSYNDKTVEALRRHLMADIPGLDSNYARVMAEDAFYIDENYVIQYLFKFFAGDALLSQFQVQSTTLHNNQINLKWSKLKASVSYTAQTEVIVHARRRRRWIGGGRRRCAKQFVSRGVTNSDISKLHSTLTSYIQRVGQKSRSTTFVQGRVSDLKQLSSSKGSCPTWKPIVNLKLDRTCLRLHGPVPKPYRNVRDEHQNYDENDWEILSSDEQVDDDIVW